MTRSLLLIPVLLCAVLPCVARAQLPGDAPRNEPLATPPLVTAPPEPQDSPPEAPQPEPRRDGWHPVARVALETVGGTAGELGGLIASLPLSIPAQASIICVLSDNNGDCDPGPTTRGYILMMLTLTAGETLGVYGAGALAGGEGRLLPTIGGSALGTGAALALFSVAQDDESVPGMVAAAVLPTLGAVLGYELSAAFSSRGERVEPSSSRASLRLMPMMGQSREGVPMAGLIGRF
ncbi:hypothetical protein [Hyalangium gracile]|uniref:hypothetical protein n=1 Tax=Hyalangium gracile TaxID=394092 RepID=UPI001CCFF1F0|nr:hypothetical protein [Hyalangium gracile]